MKNKRFSYSVLNAWANGRWEDAVKMYLHLETYTSTAMEDGKILHKRWEDYITANGKLPEALGGTELLNPVCEGKIVVEANGYQFVGIIDCYTQDRLLKEFKTGMSTANDYARTMQGPYYAWLKHLQSGVMTEAIDYHTYNEATKTGTFARIWLTPEIIEGAEQWAMSNAAEMAKYLDDNNIEQLAAEL